MKFLSRGFSRSFGIGLFLGLLLLAAAGYWSVLQDPEAVLAFNDGSIEFALSPMFSYPRAMVRIWDNGFFFGAGSGQYPVSFVGLGETLFGPHHYRRLFPAVILALAGLGMYWALRSFRLSRPVCALMAGIAMLSAPSFHFAMVGLSVRPIAMACAFLAVGFAERGRFANRSLPYAIGGGCLGLGVTEVPDVGALYALTAAGLIVWTHAAACRSLRDAGRMLARLVLLVAASGLLAYQTIDNVFQTQIRGVSQGVTESTPEERYNWAT
ncbi:MAG: hypothetical protein U1E27_13675, partial [Kiritimatiellia bacterium]|nr:hypothetical protein [Kiritimatiellia bacterium]